MRCSARLARAHADVSSAGFYAGAGPSAAAAHAAIAEGLGDAPTAYSNHSATAAMGWPPRTTDGAAAAAYARLPLCRYRCGPVPLEWYRCGPVPSLRRRDFTVSTVPPDTPCEHWQFSAATSRRTRTPALCVRLIACACLCVRVCLHVCACVSFVRVCV